MNRYPLNAPLSPRSKPRPRPRCARCGGRWAARWFRVRVKNRTVCVCFDPNCDVLEFKPELRFNSAMLEIVRGIACAHKAPTTQGLILLAGVSLAAEDLVAELARLLSATAPAKEATD